MRHFELTEQHVALLRRANVGWGGCYDGAPQIDAKRPFGNSDVVSDIANIIGIKRIETDDEDAWPPGTTTKCMDLFRELETALAVVLASGGFVVGRYKAGEYRDDWQLVYVELEG